MLPVGLRAVVLVGDPPDASLALPLELGAGLGLRVHPLEVVLAPLVARLAAVLVEPDISPAGAVMSSAVDVRVGSQSNTTPSPGPITTVDPATAPAEKSPFSTPSFARRSARKPTASSLVKSVCATQRSGLVPRTR